VGAKTLKDVAHAAGVSSATASLVLNGRADGRVSRDIATKVEEVAFEMNYSPNLVARSLRTQQSKTLAIISDTVGTTHFAVQMLQGAQNMAWEHGWLLLVVNSGGDSQIEATAAQTLIQRNTDGFIYAAMYHQEVQIPKQLTNQKVVFLDCVDKNRNSDSVVPDEYNGALSAVQHLISFGHKRIAHITTSETVIAATRRHQAYKDALVAAGLPELPEYVAKSDKSDSKDGYLATKKLLTLKEIPTAIFCYTDRMALGAYGAIQEAGLSVPRDISIVGFDDQPDLAVALHPSLTTVKLPHYEMGAWAVAKILKKITNENEYSDSKGIEEKLMNCPLIERESVAPPRN
jgi:LacI family transcriptional regulator